MSARFRGKVVIGIAFFLIGGLMELSPEAAPSRELPTPRASPGAVIPARPKTTLEEALEGHQEVARPCKKPRSFRRITMKGGTKFARPGEVFAFDKREIRLGRCEEVEITLENTDAVRHALMIPGLNPMFTLEFTGPMKRTARFVTPDEDITMEFHCHVPSHEDMGMHGRLIIGKGGKPKEEAVAAAGRLFEGVGNVIHADLRKSLIVVDHEEIEGFMGAMIMGYPVKPASLLKGLKTGDRIRFTIDGSKKAIVQITR